MGAAPPPVRVGEFILIRTNEGYQAPNRPPSRPIRLKIPLELIDEEHPGTLSQIQTYLSEHGIKAITRAIDGDISAL